jgi:hypothetical protein
MPKCCCLRWLDYDASCTLISVTSSFRPRKVLVINFYYIAHIIEGNTEERTEMTGRRGSRCKQLLDDFKEKREYWKLKEEALDRTLCRIHFGRGYEPVIRQTTEKSAHKNKNKN